MFKCIHSFLKLCMPTVCIDSKSIIKNNESKGNLINPMRACSVVHSFPTLCNPVGYSRPGSSVHGIIPGKYRSGLPFPPPGDLPDPGTEPASPVAPASAGRFFTTEPPGKPCG